MPARFLITDHAMKLAKAITGMFELDPEQQKEVFGRVFEACRTVLESYEEKAGRMSSRVHPASKGSRT